MAGRLAGPGRLEHRVVPVDEQQELSETAHVIGERGRRVREERPTQFFDRAEQGPDVLPSPQLPGEIEDAPLRAGVQRPGQVLRAVPVQARGRVVPQAPREPAGEVRVADEGRGVLRRARPREGLQRRDQAHRGGESEGRPRGAPGVDVCGAEPPHEQGRHLPVRDADRQLTGVGRRSLRGQGQREARLVIGGADHVPLVERQVDLSLLPPRGHQGPKVIEALGGDLRCEDEDTGRLVKGAKRVAEQQVHLEDAHEDHPSPAHHPPRLEGLEAPLVGIGELELAHLRAPGALNLRQRLPAPEFAHRASRVGLEPLPDGREVMAPLGELAMEHAELLGHPPPR